jgi:hypothetical protein
MADFSRTFDDVEFVEGVRTSIVETCLRASRRQRS